MTGLNGAVNFQSITSIIVTGGTTRHIMATVVGASGQKLNRSDR